MLHVKNISFSYNDKPFIENQSFQIKTGENVSVIGASGCGKSTLLQIIYGLHHVQGNIFWNEKQLLGPNFNLVPGEDFMKYLAQDFDLMPSISVTDNVGKYLSNMYPRKKQQRISELLELVEMKEMAKIKAKYLSGGQQQRVALARVLAKEPEVLLLDEPFSHIDHFRRNKLRRKLFSYFKEKGITCIVATHDSTDALSFADETIVMKDGDIIAKDAPQALYQNPKNVYVASLFGEVNILPVKLFFPEKRIRKKIVLYPHEIKIDKNPSLTAEVQHSYFRGSDYLIEANLGKEVIFFEHSHSFTKGKAVNLLISEELIRSRFGGSMN